MNSRSRSKSGAAIWDGIDPVSGVSYICGVPIDRSKTFDSIDAGLFQRKSRSCVAAFLDKFYIETGLTSMEPWETAICIVLFAIVLAPIAYWLCVLAKVLAVDYLLPYAVRNSIATYLSS